MVHEHEAELITGPTNLGLRRWHSRTMSSAAPHPDSPWHDLETYVRLPRLSGLLLSHDGGTLVVSRQDANHDATEYTTSLWRVDLDGTAPARRLTRSVKGEAAAAFLRDGTLVFTSKRDIPQTGEDKPAETTTALWALPPETGEAHVLARRDGGWGQILTSPDSDTVVVGVLAHAGVDDDEADAAKRKQRLDRKISALLHDAYPVRYWDHDLGIETTRLRAAEVGTDAAGDAELTEFRDLTGDVGRAIADTVLSRDGRTLVVTCQVPGPGGSISTRLVSINVATGERRTIAEAPDADFADPVISDDGSFLIAARRLHGSPTMPSDITLWHLDLETGEGRTLASDWDRWPTPVALSPDGGTLYAVADEDGNAPVFAVDISSGEVRRLTDQGAYSSVVRSPDGGRLYGLRASYTSPGEVVSVEIETGAVTVLRAVEYPELPGRVERVECTADDGVRVPGYLIVPESASAENPVPLTVWVHGGPLNSWNAWSWRWNPWLLVSRGQAVLLPDPALSTGYGLDYIRRAWGNWGSCVHTDVFSLVDAAEARPEIRDDLTVLAGGSFGGYMANWIASRTDRFKAIISHASLWNLPGFAQTTDAAWYWLRQFSPEAQWENSPHRFAERIRTPMLVIHGDKDYRVPIGEGLALWQALVSNHDGEPEDLPHRFLYFPDENHWILTPQHAIVWYETVLAFAEAHRTGHPFETPESL